MEVHLLVKCCPPWTCTLAIASKSALLPTVVVFVLNGGVIYMYLRLHMYTPVLLVRPLYPHARVLSYDFTASCTSMCACLRGYVIQQHGVVRLAWLVVGSV